MYTVCNDTSISINILIQYSTIQYYRCKAKILIYAFVFSKFTWHVCAINVIVIKLLYHHCFLWVDINVAELVKWTYDIIWYRSHTPWIKSNGWWQTLGYQQIWHDCPKNQYNIITWWNLCIPLVYSNDWL